MGGRTSKIRKNCLSDAELGALIASTKLTKNEILKWHKGKFANCS